MSVEKKNAPFTAPTANEASEKAGRADSRLQSITPPRARQAFIADILPIGEREAVPLSALCSALGWHERKVRQRIEVERRRGLPICSATGTPSGYFLAGSTAELERFIRGMRGRAHEIETTCAALERLAGEVLND